MADRTDDRSLGELFAELSRETGTLIRKEVELAKTELSSNMAQVGKNAGMAAAGGALAYGGVLMLLAAIAMGLIALGVTPWLAALIVGVAAAGIGYALISSGVAAMRRTPVAPVKSMESLKEDARWVSGQKA